MNLYTLQDHLRRVGYTTKYDTLRKMCQTKEIEATKKDNQWYVSYNEVVRLTEIYKGYDKDCCD